jgi:hypothetical protein
VILSATKISCHVWKEAKVPIIGLADYGEMLVQFDRHASVLPEHVPKCRLCTVGINLP